jgi:hypothetical protein
MSERHRRGFIGMVEASKAKIDDEVSVDAAQTLETPLTSARQIIRLVRLARNFDKAIAALGPERAAYYHQEHEKVIGAKKQAQTSSDIHDMRLD